MKLSDLLSRGALRALRHRDFAIYAPFSFLASIGYWIQRLSIQWLVWQLTGSYAWLGAIVFFEAIAILAVTPFGGAMADQFDRALLARLTRAAASAIALGIGVCTLLDLITIPLLIAFVMAAGLVDGVWTTTRLTIVPNLVPAERIPAAIAFEAMSFHSTQFIGPAIAGFSIITFGVGGSFLITSVLFTSVIIALFFVKLAARQTAQSGASVVERLRDAWAYLKANPGMLRLLLFAMIASFCLRPYREFFAGFSDDIFMRGAEGLAMLATASGLGAFLATLVIGGHGKTSGLTFTIFCASVFALVSMLVFAAAPAFPVAIAGSAGLGFALTGLGISAQILLQSSVDNEKRGRVMSLWGMQLRAIPSIGGFLIGGLASLVNIRIALFVACLVFVAALIFFAWPHRREMKKLESAAP